MPVVTVPGQQVPQSSVAIATATHDGPHVAALRTYPKDTDIIFSTLKNGHIRLREQNPRVAAVYRAAAADIFYQFCTKYALPDAKDSRGWICDALGSAAFILEDEDLEDRIVDDPPFARSLCDMVRSISCLIYY